MAFGAVLTPHRASGAREPGVGQAVASLAYLWRLKFRLKEPALVLATGAIGLVLQGS